MSEEGETFVRIRSSNAGHVHFEVRGRAGEVLATSAPYPTICRLEAALATMRVAGGAAWRSTPSSSDETLLQVGRRRVSLQGTLTDDKVQLVIQAVAGARILDDRPEARRRQDLTGLRCDFSHG